LLAAAGYLGWTQWQQMQHSNGTTTPAVAPPAKSERIAPAPQVVPENSASIAGAPTQGATADSTEGAGDAAIASGQASHAVKPTGESQPSDTATATASAKAQAAKQPILVKNGASKSELSRAAVDSAAAVAPPSALAITPVATGGTMPKLIEGGSQPPTPVLAPVISQGVSQELLIKRTPPLYPPNALRQRLEGVVLLSATITTKGDVSSVKIIKGHELLAHAAVDAVKQWKYKPYLLNGVPVECQTEITVDFKAPR
jgi:TonB family protein